MIDFSRRRLARYASNLLASGVSAVEVTEQLAAVLLSAGKQKDYQLLVDDIAYELEKNGLVAHAKVTTASRLSPSARASISAQISRATGVSKVVLSEITDSSVLGGAKVETATGAWDNTVSVQLGEMKRVISNG